MRFFKYTDAEKAVYRPHIDGSWPGAGLDARTGAFLMDAHGDRRSRLTFLMYLNDDFDGGATTFYVPSAGAAGLRAYGVQPRIGTVLCFPQGNLASLVHEGSAVTRGFKCVIRTDVLYSLPPTAPRHRCAPPRACSASLSCCVCSSGPLSGCYSSRVAHRLGLG